MDFSEIPKSTVSIATKIPCQRSHSARGAITRSRRATDEARTTKDTKKWKAALRRGRNHDDRRRFGILLSGALGPRYEQYAQNERQEDRRYGDRDQHGPNRDADLDHSAAKL